MQSWGLPTIFYFFWEWEVTNNTILQFPGSNFFFFSFKHLNCLLFPLQHLSNYQGMHNPYCFWEQAGANCEIKVYSQTAKLPSSMITKRQPDVHNCKVPSAPSPGFQGNINKKRGILRMCMLNLSSHCSMSAPTNTLFQGSIIWQHIQKVCTLIDYAPILRKTT